MSRRGGLLLALLLAAGSWLWLKAAYRNDAATDVASQFLQLLQADRQAEAFALTLAGGGLLGTDRQQFAERSARQLCSREALKLAWTHPPQSHGNRLRRWLADADVEMPSLTVHFEGACLISIELRQDGQGRWRVFNFQSTAG
ncbi:MAG: hypothetical protein ACRCTL_20850 [Pseudomonas sp.]